HQKSSFLIPDDLTFSADGSDPYFEVKQAGRYNSAVDFFCDLFRVFFGFLEVQKMEKGEPESHPVRVWVDGCFDLVHFGHANALRQAKGLGMQLVVGVHSDEEIAKHKGPPVFNEQERYRLIRAIKWVDKVSARLHLPIFLKEFKRTEGISTTELVSRILARIKKLQRNEVDQGDSKSGDGHLRRAKSENSVLSIGLDLFKSSKELGLSPSVTESQTADGNESSEMNALKSTITSTWSTCGMSYVPNTVRITQFCMGQYSLDGFREPRPNDVVVYVPGTYDLFRILSEFIAIGLLLLVHKGAFSFVLDIGHLSFFEKCLEFGTYLLVGLYSDKNASFESKRMGSILTLQERLLSVLACRYVNNVIIDAPYEIPATLLDHFKVNFVAVGLDTKLSPTVDGRDPMRDEGSRGFFTMIPPFIFSFPRQYYRLQIPKERGIFRRVNSGSSVTTASVISRILQNRMRYEERNRAKEAREAEAIATLRSSQTCVGPLSIR
ncbi:Ethanolamine-phosphate cytidylyltransferase, partial [Fasciola gigantica]